MFKSFVAIDENLCGVKEKHLMFDLTCSIA